MTTTTVVKFRHDPYSESYRKSLPREAPKTKTIVTYHNNPYDCNQSCVKVSVEVTQERLPGRIPPHAFTHYLVDPLHWQCDLRQFAEHELLNPRIRRDNRSRQHLYVDLSAVPAPVLARCLGNLRVSNWHRRFATYLRVAFNVLTTAMWFDSSKLRLTVVLADKDQVRSVLRQVSLLSFEDEFTVSGMTPAPQHKWVTPIE